MTGQGYHNIVISSKFWEDAQNTVKNSSNALLGEIGATLINYNFVPFSIKSSLQDLVVAATSIYL